MFAERSARSLATLLLILALFIALPYFITADNHDDLEDIVTNPEDRAKVFGGCSEDPYGALQREGFIASGARVVPQRAGSSLVDGIDPALACRLLKLFRAARSCSPRITDGYRSRGEQARACAKVCGNPGGCSKGCARPGSSCHQYGLAVDVSSNCAERLSAAARAFGVISRIPGYPNPNHFQCIEHGASAGRSSCRTECNGGLAITAGPDDFHQVGAPSSGITGAARDLLGQQEEMCTLPDGIQVPCSKIANRGSQQPLAQGQQPQFQQPPQLGTQNTTPFAQGTCEPKFYCANSTYYYRSSACVDQVYQKCPAGCSATSNACASTSTSKTNLSLIDQIGLIAEPTSTPTGAVSDLLFELAISGEDIATLQDKSDQKNTSVQNTTYVPPAQQTFTSEDLRYSQAGQQPPQQLSALQRTLATMKDTLTRVIAYLRPFGRPVPLEVDYESEWVE